MRARAPHGPRAPEGAPNTAMTASPANFSTVPPVARSPLHRSVEALELRADALGIPFSAQRGRADEIGEENRDELALLTPVPHEAGVSRSGGGRARRGRAASASSQRTERRRRAPIRDRQRAEHANAVPVHACFQQDKPRWRASSITALGELCRRLACVLGSRTSSIASIAPMPRTSPICGQRALPVEHPRPDAVAEDLRALDEILLLEDVEHGCRRRERDGVADERPADRSCVRVVHDLRAADHTRRAADPPAIDFATVDEIGLDVEVLHREHPAGAAETRLYLVGDEDDPVLVADLLQTLDELRRSRAGSHLRPAAARRRSLRRASARRES